MQEVKRSGTGAAAKTPWLSTALQEGTFQLVCDGLQTSVQVRMSHALFIASIAESWPVVKMLRCIRECLVSCESSLCAMNPCSIRLLVWVFSPRDNHDNAC